MKKYRVIFNGDWNNYEEFDDKEKALSFASRYLWCKIYEFESNGKFKRVA